MNYEENQRLINDEGIFLITIIKKNYKFSSNYNILQLYYVLNN